MIPRVARLGTGFKGAGLYYLHDQREHVQSDKAAQQQAASRPAAGDYMLHDKHGAQTSNRVGFTATRNLPTTDPEKALRCMSWLAANSQSVRQAAVGAAAKAAGMSYADYVRAHNPYRGRKGQKPVYTLSIAWHPTKNRAPSKEEMLQAADEVLKVLKMDNRQALIVEHTDTRHPHVHLIINRVSQVNGKYAAVGNDWLKLSRWALDYEKRTGLVLCHERMFNWRKRDEARLNKAERRRSDPKAKGRYVRHKQVPRRDHDWFNNHKHLPPDEIRAARCARQTQEVERFAVKQASLLLRLDQKLARGFGKDLDHVLGELDKKRKEFDEKPRRRAGLKGASLDVIRKVADTLTAKHYFRSRAITRMQRSADDLRDIMEARQTAGRDVLGRRWLAMEQRHDAERRRDETRIKAMQGKGRAEAQGTRALRQFNIRGDKDTAKHLAGKALPKALSRAHGSVADKATAKREGNKTLFARLVNRLGGKPVRQDRSRREALSGSHAQEPIVQEQSAKEIAQTNGEREKIQSPKENQNQQDGEADAVQHRRPWHADANGTDYEARVARRVDELERSEKKRKRRKRHRPRGKTRKME